MYIFVAIIVCLFNLILVWFNHTLWKMQGKRYYLYFVALHTGLAIWMGWIALDEYLLHR